MIWGLHSWRRLSGTCQIPGIWKPAGTLPILQIQREFLLPKYLIAGVGEAFLGFFYLCLPFAENRRNCCTTNPESSNVPGQWLKYLHFSPVWLLEWNCSFCTSKAHTNKAFLRINLCSLCVCCVPESSPWEFHWKNVLEASTDNPAWKRLLSLHALMTFKIMLKISFLISFPTFW